jgi:hypothetical protein
MTRNTISDSMFGARPHSHDAITNSRMLPVKSRTWPKRCVSQPVSGTEIAFATANDVMTQVLLRRADAHVTGDRRACVRDRAVERS